MSFFTDIEKSDSFTSGFQLIPDGAKVIARAVDFEDIEEKEYQTNTVQAHIKITYEIESPEKYSSRTLNQKLYIFDESKEDALKVLFGVFRSVNENRYLKEFANIDGFDEIKALNIANVISNRVFEITVSVYDFNGRQGNSIRSISNVSKISDESALKQVKEAEKVKAFNESEPSVAAKSSVKKTEVKQEVNTQQDSNTQHYSSDDDYDDDIQF